ncbi:hypothetical protein DL95DRAFT_401351 [Leptodontidium sp. 2 PMI_412]|nr:hypothetical protein DL95DRAFT_401351 [Leptodontidium sp. 2 PMI_412]
MAKRLDIYEYTHLKKKSKIGVEWSVEKWEDVAGSNLRQKSTLDEIIKASGALVYGDHSLHLGAESTKLGVEAVHKRSSELQTGDCANWLSGYSYGTEVGGHYGVLTSIASISQFVYSALYRCANRDHLASPPPMGYFVDWPRDEGTNPAVGGTETLDLI